jgi:predicted transglutaminase-like cysteine proteinase
MHILTGNSHSAQAAHLVCALILCVAASLLALNPARAASKETIFNFSASERAAGYAREYGATPPPTGWVGFCRSNPEDCNVRTGNRVRVKLDAERWSELKRINTFVNHEVEPFTDQELYNVEEKWSYPERGGDCEDYVLLKRRFLMDLGWPREALLITVVLDEKNSGHAVLTVITDRGEFVLDNQRSNVLAWTRTNYTFLKRQSQQHPMNWVSLNRTAGRNGISVSGN